MHYEGTFETPISRKEVYCFLADPAQFVTIFPDVQDIKIVDSDNFSLRAKVNVGLIRGLMDVKCTVVGRARDVSIKLEAVATGLGSSVDLMGAFSLADTSARGSVVDWAVDAKTAGLISNVGSRMVNSIAEKYVNQIIGGLKEKLVGSRVP